MVGGGVGKKGAGAGKEWESGDEYPVSQRHIYVANSLCEWWRNYEKTEEESVFDGDMYCGGVVDAAGVWAGVGG